MPAVVPSDIGHIALARAAGTSEQVEETIWVRLHILYVCKSADNYQELRIASMAGNLHT